MKMTIFPVIYTIPLNEFNSITEERVFGGILKQEKINKLRILKLQLTQIIDFSSVIICQH